MPDGIETAAILYRNTEKGLSPVGTGGGEAELTLQAVSSHDVSKVCSKVNGRNLRHTQQL